MPLKKTHYEVLGVDPKADVAQIKKAYLKRARVLHPDNNRGLSKTESDKRSRKMQELNIAWGTVSDATKRKGYDQSLEQIKEPSSKGFTYQDISEEFTARGEPVKRKGPEFATKDEMEIRGIAKLIKPIPLTVLFVIVIGVLIVGLFITGSSESPNPSNQYVPATEEATPLKCIVIYGSIFDEVPCGDRHDARVWELIKAGESCSRGLKELYASQVGGKYCVVYSDSFSQ